MTVEDLIELVAARPHALLAVFVALPLLCGFLGVMHEKGAGGASPWKYLYSVLLYAACIPGMFACVLTGYVLLFRNESLLKVNVLVYFLPIACMVASLLLTRRSVKSFDEIPGFARLSGLMIVMGISFAAAFALHRFHFGVFFFGPLGQLVIIAAIAFALLRLGANRLSGKPDKRTVSDVVEGADEDKS